MLLEVRLANPTQSQSLCGAKTTLARQKGDNLGCCQPPACGRPEEGIPGPRFRPCVCGIKQGPEMPLLSLAEDGITSSDWPDDSATSEDLQK